MNYISFELGNGLKIRFWKDKWCGNVELRRLFPNLFELAVDKECLVNSLLRVEGGSFPQKFARLGSGGLFAPFR